MAEVKAPVLVVMAAGLGSRFGGLKQMKQVDEQGHALMEYAIYDAVKAGFGEVVFIIREDFAAEFKEKIGNRVAKQVPVTYVYQALDMIPEGESVPEGRVKPWGTTHAIWCAREALAGKGFLTINADDYYGPNALSIAYDFLTKTESEKTHAIIGYEIVKTLTPNGTVSRGVCAVEPNGKLIRIDERKEIKLEDGRGYFTLDGGKTYELIPLEAVASMNMWAFRPGFIADISVSFEARIRKGIQENPIKFEETLSDAVQNILERNEGEVYVISTPDQWFGMTYIEDYEAVKAELKKLTEEGVYPAQGW